MRKIRLDLEKLDVESFDTSVAEAQARGTVHGQYSKIGTCDGFVGTCAYGQSCGAGCPGTRLCTVYSPDAD